MYAGVVRNKTTILWCHARLYHHKNVRPHQFIGVKLEEGHSPARSCVLSPWCIYSPPSKRPASPAITDSDSRCSPAVAADADVDKGAAREIIIPLVHDTKFYAFLSSVAANFHLLSRVTTNVGAVHVKIGDMAALRRGGGASAVSALENLADMLHCVERECRYTAP